MKRIGVTGHRGIPAEARAHIRAGLRAVLRGHQGSMEALSSLAVGADQLFADIALDCGAELTAVIPSGDYEQGFTDPEELAQYRRLKALATREVRLAFPYSTDEAYYAAGAYIADHCDRLLAVWDGLPARGHGGTGDIVRYARDLGKPVTVIWCEGLKRD
ncbi:hypothetical protein ACH46N_27790 [Streptomyces pristinaespiralis]|uniref:Uncharacterized protein n=2 Tax=Streptomyces pristinaespiralis TaxID=38300 RepID=B5H9S3_STRE2|nr:hypothetical protein [Streptomyces pristinaespiralis]ALC24093.1 hypothetical protein SPRI_5787 [Streptomyces pristinaespiralis]EDY63584.1 conserved hypothetical protein [Streptomyces pristinaespiralis ATCC 25486]QMU13515.1 hypothetical protein H3L99_07830 [Streptomyces pristinaespiralis]